MQSIDLVSIVTVCYNSEKTIRHTIESVLGQTYTNLEYIIIDGKSTDNTVGIVKEYEARFKEKGIIYRYLSESDHGIYDAMNKGISLSTGSWVGIINSDDWYEKDAIMQLINETRKFPGLEIFAGSIRSILEYEGQSYYRVIGSSVGELNRRMTICHPSVFVKRELYNKKLFDTSFRIAADWELIKFFANKQAKFGITNKIIANFAEGGVSDRRSLSFYMEWIRVIKTTNPIYAYIFVISTLIRKKFLSFIKPKWFTKLRQRKMLTSLVPNSFRS